MRGTVLGRPWGPMGGHACCVLPCGTLGVSVESTSAAWTEPVPVDQSSLCNIDHFPNLELKAISPAHRLGSGAAPRRAVVEITDGPAAAGALIVARRR